MGMVVRTNTMAMNAQRQMGINNNKVSASLKKLSSGFKINSAADDAAGLAISEHMKAQIKNLDAASDNSNDGISLAQTAEGALNEVHDMLNRMSELATKAANGVYTDTQRGNYSDEVSQLQSEIDRIADATNFNGIKLLDGSLANGATVAGTLGTSQVSYSLGQASATIVGAAATVTFGDGSTADKGIVVSADDATGNLTITLGAKAANTYTADEITQAVRDYAKSYANGSTTNAAAISKAYSSFTMKADGPLTTTAGTGLTAAAATLVDGAGTGGLTLQVGDTADAYNKLNVSIDSMKSAALGVDASSISIADQASAGAAIEKINTAIDTVSKQRSSLGALQNRLDHTINNLNTESENLTSANSRIRDTDMAKEMMNYTQNNVLVQAAQAMLAQANQAPSQVLQLLK